MDTSQTSSAHADASANPITAQRIEGARRGGTLSRHLGVGAIRFEDAVYHFMRKFTSEYSRGLWQFMELSNGGFYMVPPDEWYRFDVDTNGYQGILSAGAAGITVCLFACSHLSFQGVVADRFADQFHRLREYAVAHPEAGQIFAAID